jgi:hypothetical protein
MADKLAKLADLQSLANMNEDGAEASLTALLVAVTATAARLMGRPGAIMRAVNVTEYPEVFGRRRRLFLSRLPIESVTSVKDAGVFTTTAGFASVIALVADTDYVVNQQRGYLRRTDDVWTDGFKTIQVIYTAGWIDPDTESVPEGAFLPPEDLQRAIVVEAVRRLNVDRRSGLRQLDAGSGGQWLARDQDVDPSLIAACEPWIRRLI